MFTGIQIPQRMTFIRIHLQLVRFVGLNQMIDQLWRVEKMNIFVDQTVNYQQTIVPVNVEIFVRQKNFFFNRSTYSSGNLWI